ncbi:hypothetical protein [Flavobacterium sp. BFFFF1]|uniref:hypothetical protein n=1 Tax=Flavobacterium sp. BFFFF1 TaxID=2015557 RepID=UPI0025B7BD6D|nr:hypothetical protein [Flavobacterium sp. BFFFF1]
MRKFRVCILLLLSSICFKGTACGFYLEGEEVRYCFMNPQYFGFSSFSEFHYSSLAFAPAQESLFKEGEQMPNELLWMTYCNWKVPYDAVYVAVNELPLQQVSEKSDNAMIRYLYGVNDLEAISYLKFAKSCEDMNALYDDPWERNDYTAIPIRTKKIAEALQRLKTAKAKEIKSRYAFLAIRLRYYNRDMEGVKSLYQAYFASEKNKTILNYWSMYFRTIVEKDSAFANFLAAQVFANAVDKRFMIQQQFNRTVPLDETLKYAQTNQQKANVYLLAAALKTDRALEHIKKVHQLDPGSNGLSFLLLREVNKIEDWICTPYYTLYLPAVNNIDYSEQQDLTVKIVWDGVVRDRAYAKELLKFVDLMDPRHTDNPILWKVCKAHLLFMTRDFEKSLSEIKKIEQGLKKTDSVYVQLEKIKALDLTSNQNQGNAVVLPEVQRILMANQNDLKFVFAVGRELEYLGNTTDAALLYSKVGAENSGYAVYWKSRSNVKGVYDYGYSDYFEYLDINYNVKQTQALIDYTRQHRGSTDPFIKWKLSRAKGDVSLLYDALGTKYIREDKLSKALESFSRIPEDYWKNYFPGQRNYPSSTEYFDNNPFTVLKYTPQFMPQDFKFRLTKKNVTQKLIYCLNRARNPKEKNKDYYYFLAGNCYYNMTVSGNCWMMRRFGYSTVSLNEYQYDEQEFRNGNLAHRYYFMAYQNAKTPKFKALCLRLSKRFDLLKKQYPDDFKQLTDNCDAFSDYFKSRI